MSKEDVYVTPGAVPVGPGYVSERDDERPGKMVAVTHGILQLQALIFPAEFVDSDDVSYVDLEDKNVFQMKNGG